MRMDLSYFDNSFFIKIYDHYKETFGYIIKGKQISHSKECFDGTYPCLVDLSPLENLNTDDELKIEIDGDYITCSVANRKFAHEYFLANKETLNQIESLLATNTCDLSPSPCRAARTATATSRMRAPSHTHKKTRFTTYALSAII